MSAVTGSGLVLDLRPTLGSVFAGLIGAAVLYGVTVLQTVFYFQTYANDRMFLRVLVVALWAMDTASLVFFTHGVWTWLIVNFANPMALADVPWTIKSETIHTATIALCVHIFMAFRVKTFDKRLTPLAALIALVSFLPFAIGIVTVYYAFSAKGGFEEMNHKLRYIQWTVVVGSVSTAVLDVTILITLCVQLRLARKTQDRFAKTGTIIQSLTVHVVSNNLLTSIITMSVLITFFAAPNTLVYEGLNIMVSKAYANTFMAQLNAREFIRRRGEGSANLPFRGTRNLTPMAFEAGMKDSYNLDHLSVGHAVVTASSSSQDHKGRLSTAV